METEVNPVDKNWLQRLKNESWEAELLVSAVAIFAILKSFSGIDWLLTKFIDYLNPNQYLVAYAIIVSGYLAVGVLAAMFSIHFALRAYWIGLVGLNSVFPDYSLEDSAYSPIYTEKTLQMLPKLSVSITKIDELCSVTFSAAFSIMLIYLNFTVIATVYLILYNLAKDVVPEWILLIPLGLFIGYIVYGSILTSIANTKKFRSHEKIQELYFLYSKWGAKILYGPFPKSILQISMIFGSNYKRKKGLIKMILFMLFIGTIFGGVQLVRSNYDYLINYDVPVDSSKKHAYYYADNNVGTDFLLAPEINAGTIKNRVLQLFIPIFKHEKTIFEAKCAIPDFPTFQLPDDTERQKRRDTYLACYAKNQSVTINGRTVEVSFLKSDHPHTGQFGIVTYIDLDSLSNGTHTLGVEKIFEGQNRRKWTIPFYISAKN